MTEVFIDSARAHHPVWCLKNFLYRLVARRCMGILTNSSAEVESMAARFDIPQERLRFVPLHSNIGHPRRCPEDNDFVLCAGRTLRDFNTLLEAASNFGMPVVVVCGKTDTFSQPVPGNVTILREIPRQDYLRYLKTCSIVALPLLPTSRSTGQVVVLEAMACGKPVVTTNSPGTADYINHGRNGLIVDVGDAAGLTEAVQKLRADAALAKRLSEQALADVERAYTFETHAAAKLRAIDVMWHAAAGGPRPSRDADKDVD